MKKHLLTLLALALCAGMVQANPVSVSQAKYVGQQFVQANFVQARQSQDLTLVYTGASLRGEACFYVFNVGKTGFVMVSADDIYRPIIGYSDQGSFDAQNINPALYSMLSNLIEGRSNKLTGVADPATASEWNTVMNNGMMRSLYPGHAATYLCTTTWNQDNPYNLFCPTATGGPGGRCYAGCVATAMSQVMKYWNHPVQGTGNHSYFCPGYGQLSANFGATTYDWDNMPNSLSNSSPEEQKQAIATLMYHCGVSVDMEYAPDGSGSQSPLVPGAISNYFGYTGSSVYRERSSYSREAWNDMMIEHFDMGWPVYYSGCDNGSPMGCHAFVTDGYNEAGLYHWNWGWDGSGDGWFDFDAMDYSYYRDAAVFNFVPTAVYNNTAQAPTNLTVTPASDIALSATLTWINPNKTLNNSNLSSIEKIVILRSGQVVTEIENPTPGAAMTYVDNEVPRYDNFKYQVYAVCDGNHGKIVTSQQVSFGPTCNWTIIMTSTAFQGWRDGAIHVYNAAGTEVASATTTSSSSTSVTVPMPLGNVSFGWSVPTAEVTSMSFTIKDSNNSTVYNYSGSSNDLAEGIFYSTNNGCGNSPSTEAPSNLIALRDEENATDIHVSWDGVANPGYGYNIYRDGLLYRLVPEATSFVDENATIGGHCYTACVLSDGGESGIFSNESCATSGACYAPSNLDYETTGATFKIKLKWEKPVPADGLSGYYLFRATEEDGEYTRIKVIGANSTNYTDNTANVEGHYYYKLYAVYQDLDCTSAPANWIGDANQFFLHVYYSPTEVEESVATQMALYPNPTNDSFTVEATGMTHVTVYNMVGQIVYTTECTADKMNINLGNVESGIYMVRVETANGEVNGRINVIR